MSDRPVLADYLNLTVEWSDTTRHGSVLSFRAQQTIREKLHPKTTAMLIDSVENDSLATANHLHQSVLSERDSDIYRDITSDEEFWYPPVDKVVPARVQIASTLGAGEASIDIGSTSLDQIRAWLKNPGKADYFYQKLYQGSYEQFVIQQLKQLPAIEAANTYPLYIGHACVSWSDGDVRLWTDPYLRPKSPCYPGCYQPLGPLDCSESKHLVMITHSHLDHFDPGSLLLFPLDTVFLIPDIERESLLTLDLEYRLRQLGFSDIHKLGWGQAYTVNSFEIHSVPFYGEQPLGFGSEFKLKDYNIGNGYHVRAKSLRASKEHSSLLLADSGSDPERNIQVNMRQIRKDYGAVDFLFANHRRWRMYPAQFLTSSVPQYLCYVPDDELLMRQKLMMDPEMLDSVAELMGASYVIPYAMGGAPWYEEIGLGYDYLRPDAETSEFDAHPAELLDRHADARFYVEEPFSISLVLPGQTINPTGDTDFVSALQQPELEDFAPSLVQPRLSSIALQGEALDQQALTDLIEYTLFDESAFLLAAPEFCEIYYSDSEDGDYLCQTVQKLVHELGLSSVKLSKPLTAYPFSQSPAWQELFESVNQQVFVALRDGEDIIASVRAPLSDPFFASLSSQLVVDVANSLLGISLIAKESINSKDSFEDWDMPMLRLPSESNSSIENYGHKQTALALILVKVVHNCFLFCSHIDYFEEQTPEQLWFEVVLESLVHASEQLA